MLHERSSDSVRVFWPPAKNDVMKKAKRVADHLSSFDSVKDVWLFGSFATNEFMHQSDVDLCVVIGDDAETRGVDLMEHVGQLRLGIAFELHIYRESDFEALLHDPNSFVTREILGKGIHLTG